MAKLCGHLPAMDGDHYATGHQVGFCVSRRKAHATWL